MTPILCYYYYTNENNKKLFYKISFCNLQVELVVSRVNRTVYTSLMSCLTQINLK